MVGIYFFLILFHSMRDKFERSYLSFDKVTGSHFFVHSVPGEEPI